MAPGRPTDYYDGLGEEMVALMREGYSLSAAAASLGVHRQRIYDWEKTHPEFSDTIKVARGLRLFKLETDLLKAEDGPTVTSRIFALKNADGEEWRDTVRQEVTGKNGGPVQTEDVSARDIINRRLAGLAATSAEGEGS